MRALRQRAVCLLILLMLLAAAGRAEAESAIAGIMARQTLIRQLGTISVAARPELADRQHSRCSIDFSVLAQDWSSKGPGFIKVNGSFGVIDVNGDVRSFLNVVLHDIEPSSLAMTASAPAGAYFVADDPSTGDIKGVPHYIPSTPDGIYVTFRLDPAYESIAAGLMNDRVTIAVNRRQGGAELQIAIETDVAHANPNGQRSRSRNAADDFFTCAHRLMENRGPIGGSAVNGTSSQRRNHPARNFLPAVNHFTRDPAEAR